MALEALSAWQLSRGLAPSRGAPASQPQWKSRRRNQIAHYQKQKRSRRLRVYCCDHRHTVNIRPGHGKVSADLPYGDLSRMQGL